MNIKSLMVGDWVQLKTYGVSDKFEKTEAYIFVKVAEIGSCLITVEYNNDIKEPYRICENTEIEPIPLTPEILEKNGFEQDEVLRNMYYWNWNVIGDNISYDKKTGKIRIYSSANLLFVRVLEYVHELQHAIRLCEIEKEIEL